MSKNLTRKGLALGAVTALALTGFTALPASAAGLADTSFVSLAPTTGDEYNVLAITGSTFSLTSNEAVTVSTGDLKYKVNDSSGLITPKGTSTGGDTDAIATGDWLDADPTTDAVTFTTAGVANGQYILSVEADLAINGTGTQTVLAADTMVQVSVNDDTAVFISPTDITATNASAFGAAVAANFTAAGASTQAEDALADSTADFNSGTTTSINIDVDGIAAGTYLVYPQAALIVDKADADPVTVLAADKVAEVTVDANGIVTIASDASLAGDEDGMRGTPTLIFTLKSSLGVATRSAVDNSYVVDTNSTDAAADEVLVLKKDVSALARSVTVQAWMDANGNDLIDSTEYTSPVRTVNWLAAADVTAVSTVNYPTAGAANVTGSVVLTPNLNGDQQNAATDVQIGFTRPGSTATVYANATQNAVTRGWSATQSLATGNWAGMPHVFQVASSTNGTNLFTLTTSAALAVRDVVTTVTDGDDVTAAAVTTGGTTTFITATGLTVDATAGFAQVISRDITAAVGTAATASVPASALFTTGGSHGLSIGDLVTTTGGNQATLRLTRAAVTSVPSATTFTLAGTGITGVTSTVGTDSKATYVSFTEAVAGNYTAKTKVNAIARGNTSSSVTVASTADDTTLASTATVNVQGVSIDTDATTTIVNVRKGETSVELTATVVDVNDVAVTANRPVVVTLGATETNSVKTGTFTVNGTAYSSAVTLLTDANGKVTFTIGEDDGAVGSQVEVNVVPEGLATTKTAELDLIWANAIYGIFDLNDNSAISSAGSNSIVAGGSYSYSLAVFDQWKSSPADGTHRVKYATSLRTAGTDYVTLTSGRGSYTVTDSAITGQTSIQTIFTLEELQTDATWAAGEQVLNDTTNNGTDSLTYTTSVVAATQVDGVFLDTDGSTAYGSGTADLSAAAATLATVAQDRRITNSVQPAYGNATTADVTGRVANSLTNATRGGASVTISGPSNILFSDGAIDAFGSLTLRADAAGEFAVELFSNTAQVDTVITVTSGAGSKTVKVTFTGSGASFGTAIAIDAPTSVMPGTSFKVTATVTDANGNAVVTADNDQILVTYTGPGIVIATMPNDTDTKGQVSFTVLLGTNDSGTGVVSVSYDRGDDGDFTGTTAADLDITATKSITVGVVAAAAKVNAGSFKGYVALYAKGYKGQRMSAKVGKDWVVVASLASDFERVVEFTGAGVDVAVRIYIDRVLWTQST